MTATDVQIRTGATALLLVDLQPDFMPGGALPVEGGDRSSQVGEVTIRRVANANAQALSARDIKSSIHSYTE